MKKQVEVDFSVLVVPMQPKTILKGAFLAIRGAQVQVVVLDCLGNPLEERATGLDQQQEVVFLD